MQANGVVEELRFKLNETRSSWAQAIGNEKVVHVSLEEMNKKFNKRWCELTGQSELENGRGSQFDINEESSGASMYKLKQQSMQIMELQHKLEQALENVRQAEATRASLREALVTNTSLQSKLDEIRAKYAVVQASRNSSVASATRPSPTVVNPDIFATSLKEKNTDSSSVSTPREKDQSSNTPNTEKDWSGPLSNSKVEKLHREFRRARKDLAAMTASKEVAKAKLERAEKEREILAESNARLLKQITEKDEVNARSLSTILYLKGQTDILVTEKNNLELQSKTAGQLALAARLATNAKERVTDEVIREKRNLEDHVEQLKQEQEQLASECRSIAAELFQVKGKVTAENLELSNALSRIDELVLEKEEQIERTMELETSLTKAQRIAQDARSKLQSSLLANQNSIAVSETANNPSGSSISGTFSVEQLNMQISVLKSRLACPVCHERDKQCIIMRCRHMHCQQCVDEQISNRSRKCPTCNNKFSEKDVEDIWLNT
jgi:E3 ubiquitin-protein ligase BRE1